MAALSSMCPDVMTGDGPMKHLKDVLSEARDDLASFKVTDSSTTPPVSCSVCALVDSMTNDEVKNEIEESTHIMVAGVLRKLKNMTNVTYEDIESMLTQSMLATPEGNDVMTAERYMKTGDKSKFLVNGKPSPSLLRSIKSWIVRTISDKKVIDELNLNMSMLGRIVVATSECIDWLAALTGESSYQERVVMDLGVLRFPDDVNEYFQLYQVEIIAYIDVSREVFDMVDKNGIYLKFRSNRFIPRASIIDSLSDSTKQKAEGESVTFYTSKPKRETGETKSRNTTKWPKVYLENEVEVPPVIKVLADAESALKSFDIKDSGPAPVDCPISVAFDDLRKNEIKEMGEYAFMMVFGVNKTLKKLSDVSYESLKSAISNLSIIDSIGSEIRPAHLTKTYENKSFPTANEALAREVHLWLKRLINDSEVMEDLQGLIDAGTLVKCMVTAGEHLSILEKLAGDSKYTSRQIIDLTVLRYPDNTREYFHLYKIQLRAFADCTREMIDEVDKCGLNGDYQSVKFGPRKSVLDGISKRTVDRISNLGFQFYTS